MSTQGEISRNEARAAFAASGLTYEVLTPVSIRRLRTLVNARMAASGCILGTYRCKQRGVIAESPRGRYAFIRCRSDYFDDREAITFNNDGFIGFAGWADDENIKPVLDGFNDWLQEMTAASCAALPAAQPNQTEQGATSWA